MNNIISTKYLNFQCKLLLFKEKDLAPPFRLTFFSDIKNLTNFK
jgi:hypothetical protein